MGHLDVPIPEKTGRMMSRFPEMNLVEFAKKALAQKAQELAWKEVLMGKLRSEQPLTD